LENRLDQVAFLFKYICKGILLLKMSTSLQRLINAMENAKKNDAKHDEKSANQTTTVMKKHS